MQTHRIHEDSSQIHRLALVGLALLLGLILGWLLGRMSAPASLDRLPPEQKAAYIAAVADAYMAAGNRGEARALALERLRGFQDPAQAVDQATRYFQEMDLTQRQDRNIRQVNLRALASLVQEQSGAPAPQAEEGASGTGWLNWVLEFLILLVLAVMIIGATVIRRRHADGVVEREISKAREKRSRPQESPPSIVETSSPAPPWDRSQEIRLGRPASSEPSESILELTPEPDFPFADPGPSLQDADSEWERLEAAPTEKDAPGSSFSRIVPRAASQEQEETQDEVGPPLAGDEVAGEITETDEARTDTPRSTIISEDAPLPSRLASLAPQGLRQRLFGRAETQGSQLLGQFTAHYQLGIPDYDESFTILGGPEGKEPLGACGMGAHREFEMGGDSQHIWAVDVWLYDRQDIRSHSQLLASQAIPRERLQEHTGSAGTVTGEPLVPEPGMRFKLTSRHLQLECEVRRVVYVESGPAEGAFAELELAMTVSKDGGR